MRELHKKVLWTHLQIACVSIFATATAVQYLTGYFIELGYSEMQMAAYGSTLGFSAFFSILTPLFVGKVRCYKRATFLMYLFAIVTFAMGVVLAYFLRSVSFAPFVVIGFLLLWQIGMAMVAPSLLSLLHGVVGNDRWPSFYGTRSAISGIASLAISLAAGLYIGKSPSIINFLAVLMFGTAFGILNIVCVSRFPTVEVKETSPKFIDYLKNLLQVLKDSKFIRVLLTLLLRTFSYGLIYAFQTKYMIEELGMSYRTVYIWSAVGLGCATIGYKLSSYLQNRIGNLATFRLCLFLIIIDPLLWLIATPANLIPIYISLAVFGLGGVMGIVNAAYLTSHVGVVFDLATEENKSVYMSMTCLARGAAMVISPFVGGLLIKNIAPDSLTLPGGVSTFGGYQIIFTAMIVLFVATALFSFSYNRKQPEICK